MTAILDYLTQTAWAMDSDVLSRMSGVVTRWMSGERATAEEIASITAARDSRPSVSRSGLVTQNGVGIVPIHGVIAKFASQVNGQSQPRGIGIDSVRAMFREALANPNVSSILLDVDSPGGSAAGVAEMAEEIAASPKPVIAVADGMMASAAYWLASGASRIFASKSAAVGSIGVYTALVDDSARVHNQGMRVEIVRAGANKGRTEIGQPITDASRGEAQRSVDAIYGLFVDAVSAGRDVPRERALELADGRLHIGSDAVSVGLADEIGSFEVALRAASAMVAGEEPEGKKMTEEKAGAVAVVEPMASTENEVKTVMDHSAQERARCVAILNACGESQHALAVSMISEGVDVTHALARACDAHRTAATEAKSAMTAKEATLASMRANAPVPVGSAAAEIATNTAEQYWATMTEDQKADFAGTFSVFNSFWESNSESPVAAVKAWLAGEGSN